MVITRAFLQIADDKEGKFVDFSCSSTIENQSCFVSSEALNEFLFSLNIDNINLVKLLKYIEECNIIHKVCSYSSYSSNWFCKLCLLWYLLISFFLIF